MPNVEVVFYLPEHQKQPSKSEDAPNNFRYL